MELHSGSMSEPKSKLGLGSVSERKQVSKLAATFWNQNRNMPIPNQT